MARQKLGQHFLASGRILERIAEAACDPDASLTVEIGPGRGALTAPLLERSSRVIAIELDRELADFLRERWKEEPRLQIVEANALEVDWSKWGSGRLAGNLPYYLATALISKYVRNPGPLTAAVFLIQKEVADRITAVPGTRDYGYYSVECQLLAEVECLFNVPPGAFKPPPKVDSSVIRIIPRSPPPDLDIPKFLRFISACFRQKRKTLRNNLLSQFSREALDGCPEVSQRAEQLTIADFITLFQTLGRR